MAIKQPLLGIYSSQASGHLWSPTGAYEPLASVTVPSGGLSQVVFGSIPQTYSHLQLRVIGRGNNADTNDDLQILLNNDSTASYAWHSLSGDGSTAYAGAASSTSQTRSVRLGGNTGNASTFGVGIVDFLDYTSTTKNKTVRTLTGLDMNGTGYIDLRSLLWSNTAAITTINLTSRYGTAFLQYSSFSLYGIKG